MAARIRMRDAGGTLRTIDGSGSSRIRMRDAGGTLRVINRVRMRDAGNVLRVVYDPSGASSFAVTTNRSLVSGQTFGTGSATTDTSTATASGGTTPYSYAWTLISYTHPTTAPTATAPASATSAFHQTNIAAGQDYSSVFRVTATDSAVPPNTATHDVTAIFTDMT